jgi:hypothetical protein
LSNEGERAFADPPEQEVGDELTRGSGACGAAFLCQEAGAQAGEQRKHEAIPLRRLARHGEERQIGDPTSGGDGRQQALAQRLAEEACRGMRACLSERGGGSWGWCRTSCGQQATLAVLEQERAIARQSGRLEHRVEPATQRGARKLAGEFGGKPVECPPLLGQQAVERRLQIERERPGKEEERQRADRFLDQVRFGDEGGDRRLSERVQEVFGLGQAGGLDLAQDAAAQDDEFVAARWR